MCILLFLIIKSFRNFQLDRYENKKDLSERHIRPGLNIDNLPMTKVDYGVYDPNENFMDAEMNKQDPASLETRRIRRQICLNKGYYLGEKNDYVNCAKFCNVSGEEEVQYRYLDNTKNILGGREPMRMGAWCLPKTAATCNVNTSIVVYSISGWICLPRTDAFSGEGGNRIAVCNGSLWDNALNKQYDTFIPANLSFNDVYNDKLSDGRYRFVCPANLRDDIQNKYIESNYNRLHLLRNWCLEEIPFGKDDAKPDLETGKCRCVAPYQLNEKRGKCTSCGPGFDVHNYTSHLYNRPCFSVRDPTSFLLHLRKMMDHPEKEILLPCGLDDANNVNNELTKPRCLDTAIQVYKPILASGNTLKYIASIIK